MRKIVDRNWPRESEKIPLLLFGCFDRRFRGWRGDFAEWMGLDGNYPIILPGGPKDLVDPKHPRDAEYLIEKIVFLSAEYKVIGIMAHNQCLACDRIDDPAYYECLLITAGDVLRAALPGKTIILIFANFDGLYIVGEDERTVDLSPPALTARFEPTLLAG